MNNMKLNTNMENLRDIYKEIAEKTDIDTAHKIYCAFAGVQVCFPKKVLHFGICEITNPNPICCRNQH